MYEPSTSLRMGGGRGRGGDEETRRDEQIIITMALPQDRHDAAVYGIVHQLQSRRVLKHDHNKKRKGKKKHFIVAAGADGGGGGGCVLLVRRPVALRALIRSRLFIFFMGQQ